MIEPHREDKYRVLNGETPSYKAFHEVRITRELGYKKDEEVVSFVQQHIADFKGHAEDKHGLPTMLFERKQDAQKFVDELSEKLKIEKEHISIKAQKFTR